MDTASAARRWADTWERAWPTADVDAIAALYSPHAIFYSHPFRAHQDPADYARWAFSDQREAELSVRLGRGEASAHVYFSDLTYDYIRINAEYTT